MPDVGAVRAGLAKRVPSPVKPPIPKKTAAPTVRDGIIRGKAVYSGSSTFSLINPRVATQLQAKGVTVVADKPTAAMRGRGYTAPPAAAFNPVTNQIRYNPLAAGFQGSLQHEFRHAAASNIHPFKLGSVDPRMFAQYAMGKAARGNMLNLIPAIPSLFAATRTPSLRRRGPNDGYGGNFSLYDQWAEGFADRSGAYKGIPLWGNRASNYVVPNPR